MLPAVYAPDIPIQRCKCVHPRAAENAPQATPPEPSAEVETAAVAAGAAPSEVERLILRAPARARETPPERRGGLERYSAWLAEAWAHRLDPSGLQFGTRARLGGEVVRLADGVSLAWAEAMGLGGWQRLRHRRLFAAEAQALTAARAVVAISPMVAADLARWHGRTDAAVVLNPVFAAPAPAANAATELVFVGHGFARKGLDFLLNALQGVPGVDLTVVGHDRTLPRWRRAARRAGIGHRVRFVGPQAAGPWVAGARLLVHPARYEPYGNAVAEAVTWGVPVVASDRTGAACLLDPAQVWRLDAGAAALAVSITQALCGPRAPLQQPPSAAEHLAALARVLWPAP